MTPDPRLIAYIRRAASQTGADPAALLATTMQEAGGQFGHVGDNGTSFGPFQFHIGGALGSHDPAWANSYAAVLNRAQEFARLQVHGGPGAAAVQRPADRAGYAHGVNGYLATAKALLGGAAPAPARASRGVPRKGESSGPVTRAGQGAAAPTTPALTGLTNPFQQLVASKLDPVKAGRSDLVSTLMANNARFAGADVPLTGAQPLSDAPGVAALKQLVRSPQALSQVLSRGLTPAPPKPVTTPPAAPQKQGTAKPGAASYYNPLAGEKYTLGGRPGQGTHSFTAGPNNWESDNAVDLMTPYGSKVFATEDGVIGDQFGSLGSGDPRMAGLRLHLNGADNWYYAHLSKFAPGIQPGVRVKKGDLLGFSGAANGANHLHLGVQNGNPLALLGLS